jgi:hypothetical protein
MGYPYDLCWLDDVTSADQGLDCYRIVSIIAKSQIEKNKQVLISTTGFTIEGTQSLALSY